MAPTLLALAITAVLAASVLVYRGDVPVMWRLLDCHTCHL